MTAPEPRRNPTTHVPKPAEGRTVAPTVNIPPSTDPRKASDARKPGTVQPAAPAGNASATRPAAPAVKAPLPTGGEDEDPEKLLREYAERQKTKMVRLEQQLVEYKKVVAERDSLRAKVDALSKELQDAKRQLEAAAKSDEVIKDLQGKVDAAILSNSILAEDKEKLKKGLSQQTEHLKKSEERAAEAEKSLAELQEKLVEETQAREEAQARVAAALEALQTDAKPVAKSAPARPLSEAATRPMKAASPEEKSGSAPPKDEKSATAPDAKAVTPAKPTTPPQQRPPGRFSFLKK